MWKMIFVAMLVIVMVGLSKQAEAQLALRGGGGMIFDGSQLGGHVSLILPFSNKPAGVMLAGEYYKKSGVTTVPLSARGLYKLSAGKASVYVGLGSGLIYTKTAGGTALTNLSSTKFLFSAVGGVNFKFSGPLGAFAEVGLDRALISGAKNHISGKAGLSLTLIE